VVAFSLSSEIPRLSAPKEIRGNRCGTGRPTPLGDFNNKKAVPRSCRALSVEINAFELLCQPLFTTTTFKGLQGHVGGVLGETTTVNNTDLYTSNNRFGNE
jgi:hypothetical protein